jgi:hypothetical protein
MVGVVAFSGGIGHILSWSEGFVYCVSYVNNFTCKWYLQIDKLSLQTVRKSRRSSMGMANAICCLRITISPGKERIIRCTLTGALV